MARPSKQTAQTIGRRLLEIVVYDKACRIGGTLSLDELVVNIRGRRLEDA